MSYNVKRYNRAHTHYDAVPPWTTQDSPVNNVNDMLSRELDIKKARYMETAAFFWDDEIIGDTWSPSDLFDNGEQGDWWLMSGDYVFTDLAGTTVAKPGDGVLSVRSVNQNLLGAGDAGVPNAYELYNGTPSVKFTGVNRQAYQTPSFPMGGSVKASVYVGFAMATGPTTIGVVACYNGTSDSSISVRAPHSLGALDKFGIQTRGTLSNVSKVLDPTISSDTVYMVGNESNFSTDRFVGYIDDARYTQTATFNGTVFANSTFRIGSRILTADTFEGHIFWVLFISRALGPEDRDKLFTWHKKLTGTP